MATTQAATAHDHHKSPVETRQTPRGLMSGQRQPEQGSESIPSLQRYLGNSYVQALSTTAPPLGLQAKLQVSEPGDIYEQEADRIADQVVATPTHANISRAPLQIQRFADASQGQGDAAPASVGNVLASPGMPLEPTLRQDMEQRFGHDFSAVRVHTGAAAEQSARDVNAHAYTLGHNIVFAAGQFAPGTTEGRRLIAHELTHVVQQTGHGAPFIQRKEKKDESDTKTVTQITVKAGTTGEGRGTALTSDGQTLLINIKVNNLSPGRVTTGELLLGTKPNNWREIHLGSIGANRFVYDLPPGVTVAQRLTIIVEPSREQQARARINALPPHIRDFLTSGKRNLSGEDLLKATSAGQILERYGVTEDELLLQQQRRIDRQEVGLQQAEYADLEDWALSYVGFRQQARAAEQANATTLLEAAQRLSMASPDLARFIRGMGVLQVLEPDTKKIALSIDIQIRRLSLAYPNSAFRNLSELQSVLQTFEPALIADLRTLATSFLDDTEARLIRMQQRFIGQGGWYWGPGYLEDEIKKVKNDPDVIKVQEEHKKLTQAIDQEQQEDDQDYRRAGHVRQWADLYYKRKKQRRDKREKEQRRYAEALRQTVAKKSMLKLPPGSDVDAILSANSGRRAQVLLNNYIVDGRAKVREAREKLSDAKFLYAADIVIDKEKEHFGEVLGAKRSDVVNGIIDQFARQRRAQTTIWQDIWKVFEFAASFIPGPIGWATRGIVAVVEFDKKIGAAKDQRVLSRTGLSEVADDPNAALSAIGEAAVQMIDVPGAAKGAKRLTLGLRETSVCEAATLGEHGAATTLGKQVIEPPVVPQPVSQPPAQKPPAPPPAPPLRVIQGGGQDSGTPTGMLRDIDAPSRSVQVPTSHPIFKGKLPANDILPGKTPQQQVVKKELAATGTEGPVGPLIVKGSDPSGSRIVASGGGNSPGGRTPTPGSVRPAETPARPPARPPQNQPPVQGAHPNVIPRDQPRRGFEDEEPTLVDLEPAGGGSRGSATPSGGGPSQVPDTVQGETPRAPRTQEPSATPSRGRDFEEERTEVEFLPAGAAQQESRATVTPSGRPSQGGTTASGVISESPPPGTSGPRSPSAGATQGQNLGEQPKVILSAELSAIQEWSRRELSNARQQLRQALLPLAQQSNGGMIGRIEVAGIAFHDIKVIWRGGELQVGYFGIERVSGLGMTAELIQEALEQAAVQIAQQVGVRSVRVFAETVVSTRWRTTLQNRKYTNYVRGRADGTYDVVMAKRFTIENTQ